MEKSGNQKQTLARIVNILKGLIDEQPQDEEIDYTYSFIKDEDNVPSFLKGSKSKSSSCFPQPQVSTQRAQQQDQQDLQSQQTVKTQLLKQQVQKQPQKIIDDNDKLESKKIIQQQQQQKQQVLLKIFSSVSTSFIAACQIYDESLTTTKGSQSNSLLTKIAKPLVYRISDEKVIRLNIFKDKVCLDFRSITKNVNGKVTYTEHGLSFNVEEFDLLLKILPEIVLQANFYQDVVNQF